MGEAYALMIVLLTPRYEQVILLLGIACALLHALGCQHDAIWPLLRDSLRALAAPGWLSLPWPWSGQHSAWP
jgi:hypothetical protein